MAASTPRSQAETGIAVKMNTVDHGTFQDQISTYLQRHARRRLHVVLRVPDEVLRGPGPQRRDRRRVGEGQGQLHARASPTRSSATTARCTASRSTTTRGRSSTARASSRTRATPSRPRWDDLKALATKMKADGLTPIAFGDKDGWPAMGTFDILNLRLNGYDFHVGLMAGKEKWTDPKVTPVFQKWAEIVPFHAKDYAGLTWQNAADTLVQKKSGMYLLGLFVSAQFAATKDPADLADLDFFPFPTLGTQYDAEKALDAPIDTFQIAVEVAEPRGRARRGQGVPRVLGEGLDPGAHVQEPAGPDPDRQRRRHQHLQPAPEEGRRDRRRRPADHPVPGPRHALRLRRSERHAELPPEVPRQPDPGPRRLSRRRSRTSGTRCLRSPSPTILHAMAGPARQTGAPAPPGQSRDRRGGRLRAPAARRTSYSPR